MKRSTQTPYLSLFAIAILLFAGAAAAQQSVESCGDSARQQFQADADAGVSAEDLGTKWAHCNQTATPTTSTQLAGPLELATAASKTYVSIGSTFYEQLNSCGYHPQGEIVTCDVEVKRRTWYGAFPGGSNEYVRFCFDCNNDGIWEDSTLGIVHVTNDVSGGPLSFYFNAYATANDFCPQNDGQDFRIRAVLAWQQRLNHGFCANPSPVIWGNAIDFTARRDP